jgi:hypothetical protein
MASDPNDPHMATTDGASGQNGGASASGKQTPKPESAGGRAVRYYDGMRAWGAVGSGVSAIIAVLALVVVVKQFNHAIDQFEYAQKQSRRDAAIKATLEGNAEQVFISRHCLGTLNRLELEQLRDVHDRRDVKLTEEQADWMRRCFADLTASERGEAWTRTDDGKVTLTAYGSAKLAARANRVLDRDELMADFVLEGVADASMLRFIYGQRICLLDKPVVDKLRQAASKLDIEEWRNVYEIILRFESKDGGSLCRTQSSASP